MYDRMVPAPGRPPAPSRAWSGVGPRRRTGRRPSSRTTSSPSSTAWSWSRRPRPAGGARGSEAVRSWPLRLVTVGRPSIDPQDGPDPVPLELVGPLVVVGPRRGVPAVASMGGQPGGSGRSPGAGVHPVDHPLSRPGGEQDVAALDPLAVEDHLHLAVGPLLALVGAVVPDGDRPAAVLARRDRAGEGRVLQRVVLAWARPGGCGPGRRGRPFGRAQDTSTPSRSSRKSQWRLEAWCSWITNEGRPDFFGVPRWPRPQGPARASGPTAASRGTRPGGPSRTLGNLPARWGSTPYPGGPPLVRGPVRRAGPWTAARRRGPCARVPTPRVGCRPR